MEVAAKDEPHLSLLSSILDPYLLILASYLTLVVTLLVWLTRSAIIDDLLSIPSKPRAVKQLLARTGLSLIATWYYMIKYMFWSYSAFLKNIQLTGGEITTIPQCGNNFGCKEKIAAAKILRVSSWLRETSLFEEAWLHVVGSKVNWWWSVEICTFTVGVMALQMRLQDKEKTVPHLWAYMLLGQTVAISVAWNLVETAIEMREWLRLASKYFALPPEIDHSSSGDSDDEESSEGASESEETSSLASSDSDTTSSSDDSASHRSSNSSPSQQSESSDLRTTVWKEYHIYSMPRYGDLVFSLAMVSAGLLSVWRTPTSLSTILVMHLCPLLLLLPIPLPSKPVSDRWRWIISTSSLYTIIAASSIIIRLKAHWDAWPQLHLLLPTFTSHPAQSSISADAVCLTISVMMSLYSELEHPKGASQKYLLLLAPLLGPSAVLAIYLALKTKQEQKYLKDIWQEMDTQEKYQTQDMLVKDDYITTYRSTDKTKEREDKKTK